MSPSDCPVFIDSKLNILGIAVPFRRCLLMVSVSGIRIQSAFLCMGSSVGNPFGDCSHGAIGVHFSQLTDCTGDFLSGKILFGKEYLGLSILYYYFDRLLLVSIGHFKRNVSASYITVCRFPFPHNIVHSCGQLPCDRNPFLCSV